MAQGFSSAWQEYERWNQVIADVAFPVAETTAPAYLDLEESQLAEIASQMSIPTREVVSRLASVVASTIDFKSHSNAFKSTFARVQTWRRTDRTGTYPVVATLAIFSLAAERMAHGAGMNASNYYGRLSELLGGFPDRLGASFRKHSEPMWNGLNLWLLTLDGERGTPSAYSIGLRYVGVPMSQALVREADRRRLEGFFTDFDLAPRSAIPALELEPLLTAWFQRQDRGSHLKKLWGKSSLQPRIAEIASIELEAWNGVDASDSSHGAARGRITLALQSRSFPRRSIRLFPLFFLAGPGHPREVELVAADEKIDAELEPTGELQGAMAFQDRGLIDSSSLLGGVLQIQDAITGEVTRQPRSMVVFRKDDLSGLWLETKQVLLGDDVIVLASERITPAVSALLVQVARPGWSQSSDRAGLPEGWTLFESLEIFSHPAGEQSLNQDLQALLPLTSSQLKFAGGMSLPGATRNRWHSSRPPEIRALNDGDHFSLHLIDLGDMDDLEAAACEIESWNDNHAGSIICDLSELDLADGRYAVEMRRGELPLSRREFSLHSSNQPDSFQVSRAPVVQHDLDDPLAVLGAGGPVADGTVVHGVIVEFVEPRDNGISDPPNRIWWASNTDQTRTRGVTLRKPSPQSCFYTGTHHIELPLAMGDNVRQDITGTCKHCGTQKRFSGSYYRNRAKFERNQHRKTPTNVNVAALPPINVDEDASADWDVALDALRFLGGGPVTLLERVARQIDPSRVFTAEFITTLESLGHIEVRRSASTLDPLEWQVSPTACTGTGTDRVLTGSWPSVDTESVHEITTRLGGTFERQKFDFGPSRVSTTLSKDDLMGHLEIEAVLADRAGEHLAEQLPRLSSVVAALPRISAVSVTEVQFFDPGQAAWVEGYGMDEVGSYRVGRYGAAHYIRTEEDLRNGTLARSSVYLAKHWAAVTLTGKPLLAYSLNHRMLAVPLGALLPGMYQRAVVLDSGVPPQRVNGRHAYRDVSPQVASRITYLLEN